MSVTPRREENAVFLETGSNSVMLFSIALCKDSKLCLRISAFLLISKDSTTSWSSLGSVLASELGSVLEAETTLSTLELESAEDSSEDELEDELSKSFSSESESSISGLNMSNRSSMDSLEDKEAPRTIRTLVPINNEEKLLWPDLFCLANNGW